MKRLLHYATPFLIAGLLIAGGLVWETLSEPEKIAKPTNVARVNPEKRTYTFEEAKLDIFDQVVEEEQKKAERLKEENRAARVKAVGLWVAAAAICSVIWGIYRVLRTALKAAWRMFGSKTLLLCATVAFILCGLFPPWLYTFASSGTHSETSAGYSFILIPPPPKSTAVAYGIKLDVSRLGIEWFCILVIVGTGSLMQPKLKRETS